MFEPKVRWYENKTLYEVLEKNNELCFIVENVCEAQLEGIRETEQFKKVTNSLNENVICRLSMLNMNNARFYETNDASFAGFSTIHFYITSNSIWFDGNISSFSINVDKEMIERWLNNNLKLYMSYNKMTFDDHTYYQFKADEFVDKIVEQINTLTF